MHFGGHSQRAKLTRHKQRERVREGEKRGGGGGRKKEREEKRAKEKQIEG